MADGDDNPLIERAKFFREHMTTVLNLATGALVLSVTFLHDQAGHLQGMWLLQRSWLCLLVTIFCGVAYSYILDLYIKFKGSQYGVVLLVLSFAFHASFLVAICYLFRFGVRNI